MDKMVVATKYGLVGWLFEEKVLTPHTSVVLYGDRLVVRLKVFVCSC